MYIIEQDLNGNPNCKLCGKAPLQWSNPLAISTNLVLFLFSFVGDLWVFLPQNAGWGHPLP